RSLQELFQLLAGMSSLHKSFADQECVIAGISQTLDIRRAVNPALRNSNSPVGNHGTKLQRGFKIHLERLQVAVVDPDQIKTNVECAPKLQFVMDFAEHVQLLRFGRGFEGAQLRVAQSGDDEQDGVGAM